MKTTIVTILFVLIAGIGSAAITPVNEKAACLECHGDLGDAFNKANVHEVFKAGKCSSCHNPHAAKHAGLLNNNQAALCAACHRDIAATANLAVKHPPVANGECRICHNPHASDLKGLKTEELPGMCVGCHANAEDWTGQPIVHKPVARGMCLVCHDSHGSSDRGLLKKSVPDQCLGCHKDPLKMKAAHAGRTLTKTDCTACHDPHASKVKGLLRKNQHKPFASGNCTQCHGDLDTGGSFAIVGGNQALCLKCHRGIESFKEAVYKHNLEGERSCVACHNPHAANGDNLLLGEQVDLCMGCHFNDVKSDEKDRYITHDGIDCVNCHQPHGGDDPNLLITRDAMLCAGCHEAAHRVSHPIGEDVIDPRTEEQVTCLSCHQLHGASFAKYLPLNPDMALCVQCHKK